MKHGAVAANVSKGVERPRKARRVGRDLEHWYSDRFRSLCRAAGVPVIRLHSVRHSLAFWLHSLGVTPADASALLGHTAEVHLSTYLPDSGQTGIAAAAAALGRAAAAGS